MAKYLAGQQVAASSELMRVLAKTHGTGFGLTASPERMRTETMDALRSSVATLEAKAPTEVEPYRQLVLGVAEAVAEAKGGRGDVEAAVIEQIQRGPEDRRLTGRRRRATPVGSARRAGSRATRLRPEVAGSAQLPTCPPAVAASCRGRIRRRAGLAWSRWPHHGAPDRRLDPPAR